MKNETSRRDFLGISALGLAAAVAPPKIFREAAKTTRETSGETSEISVRVTSGEKRFAAASPVAWNAAAAPSHGDQIQLIPGRKFQEILGFGGAFTDAACYTFHQVEP
ncbi:MAG: hypothetical protein ACRD41_09995, partial [Candidatus Acidiferrales bacterium]